jgi:hypothetical protein
MTFIADTTAKRVKIRDSGQCTDCRRQLPAGTLAAYYLESRLLICLDCAEIASLSEQPTPRHAQISTAEFSVPVLAAFSPSTADDPPSPHMRNDDLHAASGATLLALKSALGDGDLVTPNSFVGRLPNAQVMREPAPAAATTPRRGPKIVSAEDKFRERLDTLAENGVLALHNRQAPGRPITFDHIVIGPSGVHVIAAERYRGRPRRHVQGGLLRAKTEKLLMGGRDWTKLVDDVRAQVQAVERALAAYGEIETRGLICFVDADGPLLGGAITVAEVELLWPRKAVERTTRGGALSPDGIAGIATTLATHFRPI